MSILIAKKYVKALISQKDVSNISQINDQLKLISSAFSDSKFNNIISSIDVDTNEDFTTAQLLYKNIWKM